LPFWIGNYLKFQLVPRNQKTRSCIHFFFGQPPFTKGGWGDFTKGSENPPLSPFSKGEVVVVPFRQVMISQMLSKEKLILDKSGYSYSSKYLYIVASIII
jgi:hypothetical protein